MPFCVRVVLVVTCKQLLLFEMSSCHEHWWPAGPNSSSHTDTHRCTETKQKTRRKAKQEFYFLSCAHTVSAETRDGGEGGEKGCLQLSKCILVTKVKGQHLALGVMWDQSIMGDKTVKVWDLTKCWGSRTEDRYKVGVNLAVPVAEVGEQRKCHGVRFIPYGSPSAKRSVAHASDMNWGRAASYGWKERHGQVSAAKHFTWVLPQRMSTMFPRVNCNHPHIMKEKHTNNVR